MVLGAFMRQAILAQPLNWYVVFRGQLLHLGILTLGLNVLICMPVIDFDSDSAVQVQVVRVLVLELFVEKKKKCFTCNFTFTCSFRLFCSLQFLQSCDCMSYNLCSCIVVCFV